MAKFIGGAPVDLTGTTPVVLVSAPGASKQRKVEAVWVDNRGSAQKTFILKKVVSGTGYDVYPKMVLPAGSRGQMLSAPIILDGTTDTLTIEMDAAISGTAPKADFAALEVP
jgi:hypothetical protein